MTEPLEAVLERLGCEGPTDMFISEEEYALLREEAGRLWTSHNRLWGKDPRSAGLFLAFLRGYTFYRQLHDNERQFWTHFYEELKLPFPGTVGADQRNALWDVLKGHPLTRPHCHLSIGIERDRREFVRAIDEVWGVRSLSATQLIAIFTDYHLHHAGRTVDPALLRSLLPGVDDLTLRQARAYDRIFSTLSRVIDHILDANPGWGSLPPAFLTRQLTKAGLDLGQPNVITFLANKSPNALAEIISTISQTPRKRFALRPHSPRQKVIPSDPHRDVSIQLPPGVYEVGSTVSLDVIDRARSTPEAVRVRVAERRLEVHRGQVTLHGLPEGHHAVELELDGQVTGVTTSIQIVPRLQWAPRAREGRLVEGHWEVGRVSTPDGRFALFTWCPRWADDPVTSRLTVKLDDELELPFDLTGTSIGARLIDVRDGQILTQVRDVAQMPHLAVRPLLPSGLSRRPDYRVFLESHSERLIPAGPEGLEALLDLPGTARDRLIVEVAWDGSWHRVLALPYDIPAQLTGLVPSATTVQIEGFTPAGGVLSIEERGAWSGEVRLTRHAVAGRFQIRRALRLAQVLEERQIVATLAGPDGTTDIQTVITTPGEFADQTWATTGLGLSAR